MKILGILFASLFFVGTIYACPTNLPKNFKCEKFTEGEEGGEVLTVPAGATIKDLSSNKVGISGTMIDGELVMTCNGHCKVLDKMCHTKLGSGGWVKCKCGLFNNCFWSFQNFEPGQTE